MQKKNNDNSTISILENNLHQILNATNFFIIKENLCNCISLFGDISPDFNPNWLIDIFDSSVFTGNNQILHKKSWNNLFHLSPNIFNFKNTYSSSNINEFNNSGWYKYSLNNNTLFLRANKEEPVIYPGHYHEDFGHFSFFIKNFEFLIDPGRLDYLSTDYCKPESHNAITINNLGVKSSINFIDKFNKFNNNVLSNYIDKTLVIKYITNGFSRFLNNFTYQRLFNFSKNKLIISDNFNFMNNNEYKIKRFFHFNKSLNVLLDNNKFIITGKNFKGVMKINNLNDYQTSIINGGNNPLGYQCESYGVKYPSYTVIIEKNISKPVNLEIEFNWD